MNKEKYSQYEHPISHMIRFDKVTRPIQQRQPSSSLFLGISSEKIFIIYRWLTIINRQARISRFLLLRSKNLNDNPLSRVFLSLTTTTSCKIITGVVSYSDSRTILLKPIRIVRWPCYAWRTFFMWTCLIAFQNVIFNNLHARCSNYAQADWRTQCN